MTSGRTGRPSKRAARSCWRPVRPQSMDCSSARPVAGPEFGVLLDLDQTLVLTSDIEHLRRRRDWLAVYSSFGDTRLPPSTVEFLRDLRTIATTGVVTTSPRSYAERLLRHHGLDVTVLVAYHDVRQRKPHPAP